METKDLIDAIADGDSRATQAAFDELLRDRVQEKIEQRREEIAGSMFESQSSGAIDDLNRKSRGILAKPKAAPEPEPEDWEKDLHSVLSKRAARKPAPKAPE